MNYLLTKYYCAALAFSLAHFGVMVWTVIPHGCCR